MSDKNVQDKFVIHESTPNNANEEKMWCRISPTGQLEYVDWMFVRGKAAEFDKLGVHGQKDQTQVICKLMYLVRQQTLERSVRLLTNFSTGDNDSAAVLLFNPLEQKQ